MERITLEEFLTLSREEIANIIREIGKPKVIVTVPDGSRRTCIIYYGLNPLSEDFERKMMELLHEPYRGFFGMVFDHGIETLFLPAMTHGNLLRAEKYVRNNLMHYARTILTSDEWLEFYKEKDIKVKVYGNLELVAEMGYGELKDWARTVEEETKNNRSRRLFIGYACSQSFESMRLMDMAIDFYKVNGRYPTREEKVRMYYGEDIDDVDIFIRPCEVRDSDCQPPLISGKAEMYFPVNPLTEMGETTFRKILYDFIYNRLRTFGRKEYYKEMGEEELSLLRTFYSENREAVLGYGERVGQFWIPRLS